MTAVMTSRAFDIPAGSGPAVLYVVRHAGLMPGFIALACPGCLETPVLDVLRLDTTSTATSTDTTSTATDLG
jgi:hypothetical protein